MKRKWMAVAVALCLMLAGCDLLPEEEVFRTAPLLKEYQTTEFKLAACTRGDLSLTRVVSCVYVPVRTEVLKFSIGGIGYDEFFVKVGDTVAKGDLLVQLDLSDIVQRIESTDREIERLEVQIEHLEQNRRLALERAQIESETADSAARARAEEAVNQSYDGRQESLEDSLNIARLRKADYERQLDERQLRAPMDGTVTYVRKIESGDLSVAGDRVISIADSKLSLFRAETEYWSYLTPGERVMISAGGAEYEAVVMSEEELGLPVQEKKENAKALVYFALVEPSFDLSDNTRGRMVVELDSRQNVLYVPEGSVATINGQSVVYYQNEEGMKVYKNVTVGLDTGELVEIISGLEEGEMVIVE